MLVDCSGGNATMPICADGGLNIPSIVRTPSLALSRSVHTPPGPVGWHIEPVRSIATTMSTGEAEQGLHALACAETLKWSIPNTFANHVSVSAVPETTRAFGLTVGLQPVAITAVAVHFA